ncbi:Glycosyl hydrolases family 18 [Natronincola peptidivorans]|uniref:Glycosyl hydrolases family 18 n=1 Tax=Natronincola peptidivorans TaxID=426128 RepID=A0A1I0BSV1_9FIRM|nr:glycosyl hydrolase family 18 protein [Natronincola peptidivorans]SET09704.1 Glycosyl hydrolases family 18 [Natronincola peptidivorans]
MRAAIRKEKRRNRRRRTLSIILWMSIVVTVFGYFYRDNMIKHITSFAENIVSTFSDGGQYSTANILIGNQEIDGKLMIEQDEIYMDIALVKKYILPDVEFARKDSSIYIDIPQDYYSFTEKSLDAYMKSGNIRLNFLLRLVEDVYYIPLQSLVKVMGFEVNYYEDRDLVVVNSPYDAYHLGRTVKSASLVDKPGMLRKEIVEIEPEVMIRVYEEEGNYYRVVAGEGYLGYIEKTSVNLLGDSKVSTSYSNFFAPLPEKWQPDETVGLVWDYVHLRTKDRRDEEKINAVDIVSPTWFDLIKADGTVLNKGVLEYVQDAHEKGYKVWGLVTNSFDPDLTHEFLGDIEAQENFIRQMIMYSSIYQLDGINIDFENIYYKDQTALTEFVQLLTDKLHQQNLVVSIDVTIPSTSPNWSMVYDRQKLAPIVDYIAVMTYDEHWGSSPRSGSVASIGWVERGIQRSLDYIPPEKLLLGLPFYTRLWQEEKQPDGSIKVSSRAYGMEAIASILEKNDAELHWDETAGQYYAEYQQEGSTYRVWLEDKRSLALKASIIEKYNLAGFAAWRKDFEKEDIWSTLEDIVKNSKSYYDLVFD